MADHSAKIVVSAVDDASTKLKTIERSARATGEAVKRAGEEGATGLSRMGEGAQTAAAKTERATQSMIHWIQRRIAAEEAGDRRSVMYAEKRAQLMGADMDRLRPQLTMLDDVIKKQDAVAASMVGQAKSAKELQWALRGVPAQFTDIAVSIASGQRPLMVMLQQGGQLKDMFGGVGVAVRALAGYMVGLINPYTLAAAAIGTLAYGFIKGSEEGEKFARTIILTGGALGKTTDDYQKMAKAIGESGVGQNKAAAALVEMSNSGKLTGDMLERVTRAAVKMQEAGGPAVEELAKNFASLMQDPVEGSEKLTSQMGYLTAEIYKQIRAMKESGDIVGAQKLAVEAYAKAIEDRAPKMVNTLGYVERAWKAIKDASKGAINAVLEVGRPNQKTDAQLQAERDYYANAANNPNNPANARASAKANLDLVETQLANMRELARAQAYLAKSAADETAAVKATAEWLDVKNKNLGDSVRMQREIDEILTKGAKAGAPIEEIMAAVAQARKKALGPEARREVADFSTEIAQLYNKMAELNDVSEDYVETGKAEVKIREALSKGVDVPQAWIDFYVSLAIDVDEATAAFKDAEKATKAWNKAVKKFDDDYRDSVVTYEKATDRIEKAADAEEIHAKAIGKTKSALEAEKVAYLELQIAQAESLRLGAALEGGGELETINRRIAGLERLKKATQDSMSAEMGVEAQKAADATTKEWGKAAAQISNDLTDAFLDAVQGGKNAFANLAASLQRTFANLVLRPLIQGVMGPIAGGLTSMFGFAGNATASTMTGGASSYLGSGAMGVGGSLLSGTAFGSGLSISMSNLAAEGLLAGTATNFANIGGQLAAGSFMPALGMAMPYIGAAIALGLLVKGLLDSRKGGPKTGGWASSIAGLERTRTPNQKDSEMQEIVDATQETFEQTLRALGGKGTAGFSFDFDTDPEGTASNRISALARVNGQDVYSIKDLETGRDDKVTEEMLELSAKRALLAALQASDLPQDVANLLNSVVAETATATAIDNVIGVAEAFSSIYELFNTDLLEKGLEAYADSLLGIDAVVIKSIDSIQDLIDEYDGSADSAAALASATGELYGAAVQAVAQIKQLRVAIGEMFGESAQSYRMAGMTPAQQRDYLARLITQDMALLEGATDANTASNAAQRINANQQRLFSMLSPEEQALNSIGFAASAEYVAGVADDKLANLTTNLETQITNMLTDVKKVFTDVGATMQGAADTQVRAAETPLQVEVEVSPPGAGNAYVYSES